MDVNYGSAKVVDCAITDISSLRLTSRLIKNEIDYEVSRDAMKQMMASTRLICNWSDCLTDDLNAPPYPEWSGKLLLYASPRPKTYKDIKNLRTTTGTLGAHWNWDGQLLASWGIQHGHVVLPKSVTPHRIQSNLQVRELPKDAYEKLTGFERHKRFNQQSR